jgi:alpha-glucuronidase
MSDGLIGIHYINDRLSFIDVPVAVFSVDSISDYCTAFFINHKRIAMRLLLMIMLLASTSFSSFAEDGYELWLRYRKCEDPHLRNAYRQSFSGYWAVGTHPSMRAAALELSRGLTGILGSPVPETKNITQAGLIIGQSDSLEQKLGIRMNVPDHQDGFTIEKININGRILTVISSRSDVGVLYGVFQLLRALQTRLPVERIRLRSEPALDLRMLNHWDNLDRHVERGYAGIALWNWHTLPDYRDPRYTDYARANASIGINAVTVTNVNANARVLTPQYLEKIAALADIFRPYGIRIFLTARFSAPMELDRLKTADPLDPDVRAWWKRKTEEIYRYIPDFGGFLVKANSEGQPGPQNYKRSHADGANMLAESLESRGGQVIWRAFVYDPESNDRFKQAAEEFLPLDGRFHKNVMVQVKNGPIDFQPREPFSPLFGSMRNTRMTMEFQITQEYLGQATHLVYEAPMFREVLTADTYQNGKGSPVSGSISGMAGVSNIGNDRNWTGHLFGQANWYAYGRLAWNMGSSAESIAEEWIRQTFGNDPVTLSTIRNIMMGSHETLVRYMTPLGLAHIMGNGHHYGPLPWGNTLGRPDWNPVYYHRADSLGIGFDRTASGSNALSQYNPPVRDAWSNPDSCDERYLLWFHHVPWTRPMRSGKNLWYEMVDQYHRGVREVRQMRDQWKSLRGRIDDERFEHVRMLLDIQVKEAIWWRDACLSYFQTFSRMPFPEGYERPAHSLEYYKGLRFPYAPGN